MADMGLPSPDLIIQMDVDPSSAASRAGYGQERYEYLEFQNRVREGYVRLREGYKECEWVVVNGNDGIEATGERILIEVTSRIDQLLGRERKTIQWN